MSSPSGPVEPVDPVDPANLENMHAEFKNAKFKEEVATKKINKILSDRDLEGLTEDYSLKNDYVKKSSIKYETSGKSIVYGVDFAPNQLTKLGNDGEKFREQTIKLIKEMLESVLTGSEMSGIFEDRKTVLDIVEAAVSEKDDKDSLSKLFPLSTPSTPSQAAEAGGSKQRKKGGAPRKPAASVAPPIDTAVVPPREFGSDEIKLQKLQKFHVITVMLHISMALMLIVFISFDTQSLQTDLFSGNPGGSFVLGKRIAMFESKFNEAMTSCANPFSVFASSMGRRLFCKFYSEWVKAVSEFTAQTEESIIYSLFTGGTVLAGMGAVINKLRPVGGITFKAYTYFVMILAFVILYCITVLHFFCKTTARFTWEFYRTVNNVLITHIRKKKNQEVVVVEETEEAAEEEAEKAEKALAKEALAKEALGNSISGLWSAGCKLLSTKTKALREDEDLQRAAEILASLRENTTDEGGAKKKKTTSKKPTTPKSRC